MDQSIWAGSRQLVRLALSEKDFTTWISPLEPAGWSPAEAGTPGELKLDAPNSFIRDWVRRDWQKTLDHAVTQYSGEPAVVRLDVNATLQVADATMPASIAGPAVRKLIPPVTGPLPRHRFEDFVVGASNEMAYWAMRAIIDEPGRRMNPLFISGGTGLGKTHLLSAVARALMLAGDGPVALVPAETFVNDMIAALKQHRMDRFRGRYRKVQTLIVDDIQFFCGKMHSQQEFKETFNALYDGRRRIILASDRPVHELELEESLRDRCASGCMVEVSPPDPELRLRLVEHKSLALELALPLDAVTYVAGGAWENVRQLEGVLHRVYWTCRLSGDAPTLAIVQAVLKSTASKAMVAPTVDRIIDLVCRERQVLRAELLSPRRPRAVAAARQLAMYLCRACTSVALERIGEAFGGRDHSTVLYAVRTTENRMKIDEEFRKEVRRLEAYVEGSSSSSGSSSGATSTPASHKAAIKAPRKAGKSDGATSKSKVEAT